MIKSDKIRKIRNVGKSLAALCLAACVFMLAGCGSSEKVIEGTPGSQSGTAAGTAENSAGSESGGQEAAGEAEVSNGTAAGTAKGYIFFYNGTKIAVDADMAPVLAALGEPDSYFEAASCAFEGLDKIYTYGSFEIDTYPTDGKDYISAVIFKDDAVMTEEGISIGDSVDKVKDAYKDCTEETGKLVCEKDGMKLNFIIQNDAVASIEYQSTVLEE